MKVAEALSGTVTPQGFFAVIEKPHYNDTEAQQVLLIDRIQDPGNLGTLMHCRCCWHRFNCNGKGYCRPISR